MGPGSAKSRLQGGMTGLARSGSCVKRWQNRAPSVLGKSPLMQASTALSTRKYTIGPKCNLPPKYGLASLGKLIPADRASRDLKQTRHVTAKGYGQRGLRYRSQPPYDLKLCKGFRCRTREPVVIGPEQLAGRSGAKTPPVITTRRIDGTGCRQK